MPYVEQHRVTIPDPHTEEADGAPSSAEFVSDVARMLAAVEVDALPVGKWTFRAESRDGDDSWPYVLIAEVER